MSTLRSKELWTAAYFLSRCGNRRNAQGTPEPPSRLRAATWQEAYDLFFDALADGRTLTAFRRTLKNARDLFDGHLNSGRVGWRDPSGGRPPQPLGESPRGVLLRWSDRSDDELWDAVRGFVGVTNVQTIDSGPSRSRRRREHLLDAIQKEHILQAFQLFDSGYPHRFADSTKFDLLYNGRVYPSKAIVGLAGVPLYGEPLDPKDFTGGADSKCLKILTQHGFQVVPKLSEFRPSADHEKLDAMTREARSAPILPRPKGQSSPAQISRPTTVYERDPLVRAFVLRRSKGKCECCGDSAPFFDKYGDPFLEVHHIKPLAEKGEDVVENAAAICPNCHRECHLGRNAASLGRRLLKKVRALSHAKAL